jgi:hypothetical protein
MEKRVFRPLGLENLTLDFDSNPDVLARRVDLSMRTGAIHPALGTAVDASTALTFVPLMNLGDRLEDASGGSGGSGSYLTTARF